MAILLMICNQVRVILCQLDLSQVSLATAGHLKLALVLHHLDLGIKLHEILQRVILT